MISVFNIHFLVYSSHCMQGSLLLNILEMVPLFFDAASFSSDLSSVF